MIESGRSRAHLVSLVAFGALIVAVATMLTGNAAAAPQFKPPVPGLRAFVVVDDTPSTFKIPAPPQGGRIQTSQINVVYNPASCVGPVAPWPAQAQTAFTAAAAIWGTKIDSPVPIVVDACWEPLPAGVLGGAGSIGLIKPAGADSFFPIALANVLDGSDTNGATSEISASFNSTFGDWYFGTDGNPGGSKYDFLTVVLHEIGHGLGFSGSMAAWDGNPPASSAPCNPPAGQGCWGNLDPRVPRIYDRFTENLAAVKLINDAIFPNPSGQLKNELEGGAGYLFFTGSNAVAANGGNRVPLYSPVTWRQGSSYSHLDESFNSTPNALMTFSQSPGSSLHSPGPVALGIFNDIGYTVTPGGVPCIAVVGAGSITIDTFMIFNPIMYRGCLGSGA